MDLPLTERARLQDTAWRRWGPYLAERAWGTVREDYSADGDAWSAFSHDQARWRAYRWNEDGLGGFCDEEQHLCLAVALWNGVDPILKERLYGLTNPEGNHGEDVKELYFYTDATPTASYAEMVYFYPSSRFPYEQLITENAARTRHQPEFELADTGIFDNGYFEVVIRYAKAEAEHVVLEIEATNHSPDARPLWLIPTLWFRNTWSWGDETVTKPSLQEDDGSVRVDFDGRQMIWTAPAADSIVFCDNETAGIADYPKDAIHRHVVFGEPGAVNPRRTGTKAGAIHHLVLGAGERTTIRTALRPADSGPLDDPSAVVAERRADADAFYAAMPDLDPERAAIRRHAYAGLVWTKQFYHYDVTRWLAGDPIGPSVPEGRSEIRNREWDHIRNHDVLTMPDAWEYPWYATWDLAFQCVPFADLDPRFAKDNLEIVTSDRYMHPNGQLPAYEWEFGNVNPPVMAWSARKVFEIDRRISGTADRPWLANLFYLLSLNYTWWQNREDVDGNNVFQGGFLGLDNISLFDRSATLPTGGHIDQSDGTAWMGFFSLGMLRMALTLARSEARFESLAMRYFNHFGEIAEALTLQDHCLWDPDDGFFYDVLHLPDGSIQQLQVRSLVGLLPLVAVEVVEEQEIESLPQFAQLVHDYERRTPSTSASCTLTRNGLRLLSVLDEQQLRSVLSILLDPGEFLSPFGIRSLSKAHEDPYLLRAGGMEFSIAYEPGESTTALFGGNSNWRGPIWFPLNYLIIEALQEYHRFYGEGFHVEFPTGSGQTATLEAVASGLADRLVSLFEPAVDGHRPAQGQLPVTSDRTLLLFHEYFDAETGRGLGASHQTGWTALVAKLL